MYIFLNPPRSFWKIPDTDISLMRATPILEVTDTTLSSLSAEQKIIFQRSIELGIISEVDEAKISKDSGLPELDILGLPAAEIQRKYVSRMVMGKDMAGLLRLKERESARPNPRQDLLAVIKNGIERIQIENPESLEEKFYREIEVIEDVIEAKDPNPEPQKKKTRTRASKVLTENS